MNKVMLMGRLTREPEVKYSQSANPVAVARYGLAVRRSFVKPGEPEVDFFNIVAFGKSGEFAGKFFRKGQMVAIVGKLQVSTWDDHGTKRTNVDVVVEEQHFAESRKQNGVETNSTPSSEGTQQFTPIMEDDDDLPF